MSDDGAYGAAMTASESHSDTATVGFWTRPVQYLKGVGPRRAQALAKLGIETVADLLLNLPRRYLDRSHIVPIGRLSAGETVTVVGAVRTAGVLKGRKSRFEVVIDDGTGQLALIWFAGWRYLQKTLKRDVLVAVSGEVGWYDGCQMVHPECEFLEEWDADDLTHTGRIIPIYPSGEAWRAAGLESRALRRIIKPVIDEYRTTDADYLPDTIIQPLDLPPLNEALAQAHFPDSLEQADRARRRLAFDEFFFFELSLARRRAALTQRQDGRSCRASGKLAGMLTKMLPWSLTGAQRRVLDEITADLASPSPMRRLLQGDVGSGKTIVAALAMAHWVESGSQAALLVPTEILAEQHYRTLRSLFEPAGVTTALLTGSLPAPERRAVMAAIAAGEAGIIVGTHALLSETVNYADLAFAVIDEQHRFGVAQRARLVAAGRRPDLLVMTATPIPRTLALTLYGDLDVSVIDEMPPRKGTTRTVWRTEEARDKIYDYIRNATADGDLVYIVYPLVAESEKVDLKAAEAGFTELKHRFPDRQVGLVHGRTRAADRKAVMEQFYDGRLDVLVATTVIEVGVDAPDARLMVIENAERFGLSQLHQLRGRIGRGPGRSICVLMLGGRPTETARERLAAMCDTNDGFVIAEADLRLRGPGELLGTRQHGLPEFRVAHLIQDAALIEPARKAAFAAAAESPPERDDPVRRSMWREWDRRSGRQEDYFSMG
ncbi:MAG TPA: ATP-dependent DNA helicase RecG [Acidobacteriota bacterium]|nr:ATP-dependent DNA helicase RecG [Acidobacteriota bacterium]